MIDFSKTLIHSSSLGKLWVEPQKKEDKLNGELSQTAKTHLIETYIQEAYGRRKEIDTAPIKKGNLVENDSLLLLSNHLDNFFDKNEEQVFNDYIIGTPDTFLGEDINNAEVIYDVKSSYDIFTFLANVTKTLDDTYYYQIQAYMELTGANEGYIAYCLVNNPDSMIEQEKSWLLRKTNAISEDSIEFKQEWNKKLKLLIYDDIPESERILLFKVEKDTEFTDKYQSKVEKAREFLHQFQEKHLNFNK